MSEFKVGGNICGLSVKGCSKQTDKLNTYDWLADLPDNEKASELDSSRHARDTSSTPIICSWRKVILWL